MRYQIAPLFCRPWTLNGITPQLIESHYQDNYGAAVARANIAGTELNSLDPAAPARALCRLKMEEAAALNAAMLHEVYFASLGGDGRVVPELMTAALVNDFGSFDEWRREFEALALSLDGGAGWVLLTFSPRLSRLINQVVSDMSPILVGSIPVLALDMYEHAYHLDFGANIAAYVAAFMRNIDWTAAQTRYEDAMSVKPHRPLRQEEFAALPTLTVDEVNALRQSGSALQIVDVRPRRYSSRAQDMMRGAVWRDPERVEEWMNTLSRDTPVVTFCVYGFHIGCETTAKLRAAGFDARYMAGGYSAWKAIKGDVQLFNDAPEK
jgi:Fe-Mn family superoxide dismutase